LELLRAPLHKACSKDSCIVGVIHTLLDSLKVEKRWMQS